MLALATAVALFALSAADPLDLDIVLDRDAGGHAMVRFGFATIKFVFDSGQNCPITNSCSGLRL